MIVECPECHAKFAVPDTAIGDGRNVRCGKCTHVWFITPAESTKKNENTPATGADDMAQGKADAARDETAPDTEQADKNTSEQTPQEDIPASDSDDMENFHFPEAASLPVPVGPRGAPAGLIAACIGLLLFNGVLAVITFRDHLQPSLPWLYEMAGMYPTSGVSLENFVFEQRALGKKSRITIDCQLGNRSEEARRVPALSARLVNVNNDVLAKESNLLEEGKYIKPGETAPCGKIRMTNSFSSADRLILDLGSPFELKLRQ